MGNFFINLFNGVINTLAVIINGIFSLLPSSPFNLIANTQVEEFIGSISWLVPVGSIIAILELWLVAIVGYYMVMLVLRWVKAIE